MKRKYKQETMVELLMMIGRAQFKVDHSTGPAHQRNQVRYVNTVRWVAANIATACDIYKTLYTHDQKVMAQFYVSKLNAAL